MMKTIEEMTKKAADKFAEQEAEIGEIDRDALYKGFFHGAKWALSHQWESVDEVLPPIQEDVLVMTDKCIDIAYREEDSIHFIGNVFDYDASQIKAWMPIPSLPEANNVESKNNKL